MYRTATHAAAQAVLGMYMQAWQSMAILAAANFGIPDRLADHTQPVEELAKSLSVDPRTLFRLMRALASRGIFKQVGERSFSNSHLSEALRSGAPGGARELIRATGLPTTRRAAAVYERAIATGRNAWELEFSWRGPFDLAEHEPAEAAVYDEGMCATAAAQAEDIVARFDFSRFRKLVDVGGGRGMLLATVLAMNPQQRGVLFDMPHVVAQSGKLLSERGVGERCEVLGGDYCEDVPGAADGYILKNILHGCSDDRARGLLRLIHRRAAPEARLMIIELMMPRTPQPAHALFDLFLLLGGVSSRVRSEHEFRSLLEESGFDLLHVIHTSSAICVIEAQRLT